MNPAIVVAGGGAGGGGGRGGGKGSGSGNAGAGDSTGGNNPEGGDKSADGCSPGGNGACTNCGTQVSRGDPFDVTTGEVFTIPKQDLYLPGTFGLKLVRRYTSARRDCDVGMGWGWAHTLGWSLTRDDGTLIIRTGDGRTVYLPDLDEEEGVYFDGVWGYQKTKSFYAIDPGNEFVHLFAPLSGASKPYSLTHVVYRNRGHLLLRYENGALCTVTDSVGRTVRFHSTREGRIARIEVPSDQGEVIVFAQFEYDSFGQLVAATDADGATTRYRYDEGHNLTRLVYPNGTTFHFVYDEQGRCKETWGAREFEPDPVLSESVPAVLADGKTRAKGIYHCVAEYLDDEYVEVSDSLRMQRFFAGPRGKIAKAVGARGQVTERAFDENGNVIAQTDPSGGTWSWQRDSAGRVVAETNPEGQRIQIKYDLAGRVIEIVDPAEGRTTLERDAWGDIEWIRNQAGAYLLFTRDERGQVTQVIDERAAQHLYAFDAHGNPVAQTLPTGGRIEYFYDYWGRTVAIRNPLGYETRYTYTPLGRVSAHSAFNGNTTRFRYDAMGNTVAVIAPDGSTTYSEYGGHNWPYQITHPDGNQIQIRYNREGWIDYFDNERGERHAYSRHLDGLVAEERDFIGIRHSYAYDEMGRVTSVDRGGGKHELEYDRIGQVVSHLAPDGGQRRYEYNARGELVMATQDGVTLKWERDSIGRITLEQFAFDDATYTVASERDKGGARSRLTSSLGHQVEIRRDPAGQVSELWVNGEQTLRQSRNAEGRVVRQELPKGGAIERDWDVEGRTKRVAIVGAQEGSSPLPPEPEWLKESQSQAYSRGYEYTVLNEIARVSTSEGSFTEYEYDARHHVRSARSSDGSVEQFRIDSTSNYYDESPDAPARVFERGSQLKIQGDCEYVYGPEGELLGKRRRLHDGSYGKWWRFVYDGFGFLQEVLRPDGCRVSFEYDAFARRVKKTVHQDDTWVRTTHYVWDLVTLLHEVTFEPGLDSPRLRTYLYEDNDKPVPLAHRDGAPGQELLYYVTDLNGYPLELVDAHGNIRARLQHRVFGEPVSGVHASATNIRFTGQYVDEETGLHYNRYRYYDPEMGRYITRDPIGFYGGLNLYAYTINPVGWTDPMGWSDTHVTTVKGPKAFFDFLAAGGGNNVPGYDAAYDSSYQNSPQELRMQHNSHSEQTFAYDLIQYKNTVGKDVTSQQTYQLSGARPPCPTCHGAMMRAAKETGAEISYTFPHEGKEHTVTYKGDSAPQFSEGFGDNPKRKALMDHYAGTTLGDMPHQTGQPAEVNGIPQSPLPAHREEEGKGRMERWGARHPPGTKKAYTDLNSEY